MTKREKAARERRIEAAYRRACSGVQIDVMKIGDVFKAGERALDEGADDAALEQALAAYVAMICD